MPEDTQTITTFATAGGPMAVHGGGSGDLFKTAVFMVLQSIGESSRLVYLHTYYQWWTFAERQGLDPLDPSYENILAFLLRRDIAHATRQSWKTHLLRLLDWLEESETRATGMANSAAACSSSSKSSGWKKSAAAAAASAP